VGGGGGGGGVGASSELIPIRESNFIYRRERNR
jgi:hypothetical protein